MEVFHNLPSVRNVDTVVTFIVIYNLRAKRSLTFQFERGRSNLETGVSKKRSYISRGHI